MCILYQKMEQGRSRELRGQSTYSAVNNADD